MLTSRQRALRSRSAKGRNEMKPADRDPRRVVRVGDRRQPVAPWTEVKSPGLAAVLAFFCAGLGHFYVGDFGRGIMFFMVLPFCIAATMVLSVLAGQPLMLVLIWLVSAATYVYQIIDAYGCAEQANRRAFGGR
jgi:TM2 domain-containing membrane protein YozV